MSNKKKRRDKKYQGWDASDPTPTVHRIKAVQRSKFGQWRYDHRRAIKVWSIVLLVVGFIGLIISAIIGLVV